MGLGKLNTSDIVHLTNEHGIMVCLGFGVDEVVHQSKLSPELCRLCFGQGLRITHPRV